MSSAVTFAELALGSYLGGFLLALVSVIAHDALGLD